MLFHAFSSQEERRNYGGSDFIEIQYCRMPEDTEIKQIVSVDAVEHWKNDSLYIFGDDMNAFISRYGEIFTGGTYNNGETGIVDMFGINYYSREQTRLIQERIREMKPSGHLILLKWLEKALETNGFYILGV